MADQEQVIEGSIEGSIEVDTKNRTTIVQQPQDDAPKMSKKSVEKVETRTEKTGN